MQRTCRFVAAGGPWRCAHSGLVCGSCPVRTQTMPAQECRGTPMRRRMSEVALQNLVGARARLSRDQDLGACCRVSSSRAGFAIEDPASPAIPTRVSWRALGTNGRFPGDRDPGRDRTPCPACRKRRTPETPGRSRTPQQGTPAHACGHHLFGLRRKWRRPLRSRPGSPRTGNQGPGSASTATAGRRGAAEARLFLPWYPRRARPGLFKGRFDVDAVTGTPGGPPNHRFRRDKNLANYQRENSAFTAQGPARMRQRPPDRGRSRARRASRP